MKRLLIPDPEPAPEPKPDPAPEPPKKKTGTSSDKVNASETVERSLADIIKRLDKHESDNQALRADVLKLFPEKPSDDTISKNPALRVLRELGIIQ